MRSVLYLVKLKLSLLSYPKKRVGFFFSEKEIEEFNHIAKECGADQWEWSDFQINE